MGIICIVFYQLVKLLAAELFFLLFYYYRCEEDWDDYVELSNHMPMEDPKYRRLCGREPLRPFSVRSDGQFFRLSFKSNDRYDGLGFHGRFQFTDKINQMTIVNVNSACSYFLLQASSQRAYLIMTIFYMRTRTWFYFCSRNASIYCFITTTTASVTAKKGDTNTPFSEDDNKVACFCFANSGFLIVCEKLKSTWRRRKVGLIHKIYSANKENREIEILVMWYKKRTRGTCHLLRKI